jgi:tetratricopeptide (TPR) repeat protein
MALKNGDRETALSSFRSVQEKAPKAEHPDIWYRAESGVARCLELSGRLEEAVEHYEGLRRDSLRFPDRVSSLAHVVPLCRCYRELGDLSHAIGLAESALNELDALGIPPTLHCVEIASTLVGLYYERGDLSRAAYLASQTIERAQGIEDRRALGAVYWNASVVMSQQGRRADALLLIERALAIYSEGDDERALARLRNAYAGLLLKADQPDARTAKKLLDQAAQSLAKSGNNVDLAYCETSMARAHLVLGDLDAAVERATHALELLGPQHRLQSARALTALAAAHLARGDQKEAQAACERGALMLEASEAGRQAGLAWGELAEMLEECGEYERALHAYREGMRCMGWRRTRAISTPSNASTQV